MHVKHVNQTVEPSASPCEQQWVGAALQRRTCVRQILQSNTAHGAGSCHG